MTSPPSMKERVLGELKNAPGSKPLMDSGSEDHPPELYEVHGFAQGLPDWDALTDEHLRLFDEQGYLVIEKAFSEAEIADAIHGLLDLIHGANPDFRGVQFEAKAAERLGSMTREEKQDYVRKLLFFSDFDARLKAIAGHPKLLAALERMIGDKPELFQDMALLKPPRIGREKPWHQDQAYFDLPLGTRVVGVWLALDEATPENGCMHIIPGSHREGPIVHFQRRDWQLCDTDVQVNRCIAVPLKPGGVLLFHSLLHHGTPANRAPARRRALQLHYKPAGVAFTSQEERLAVFGAEGKDVQC